MLSGRAKKDYAREAQAVATAPDATSSGEQPVVAAASTKGTADEPLEAVVAM